MAQGGGSDILSPLEEGPVIGESRPRLQHRIHSASNSISSTPRSSFDVARTVRRSYASFELPISPDERLVMIHNVEKTDSLIGIALSYGISQSALRQANKLYVADSIHLRKSLKIPIDLCTLPPSSEDLFALELLSDEMVISFKSLPKVQSTPKPSTSQPRFPATLSRASSDYARSTSHSFDLPRAEFDYLSSTNNVYSEPVDTSLIFPDDLAVTKEPQFTTRNVKVEVIPRLRTSSDTSRPIATRMASFHLSPELNSPPPTPKASQMNGRKMKTFSAGDSLMALASQSSSRWGAIDDVELSMARELEKNVQVKRAQRDKRSGVVGLWPTRSNGS